MTNFKMIEWNKIYTTVVFIFLNHQDFWRVCAGNMVVRIDFKDACGIGKGIICLIDNVARLFK